MRPLGLLAGLALVILVVPASGFSAPGAHASAAAPVVTVASVTRAFAARGIPLELKGPLMAAQGPQGLAYRVLWNQKVASSQGVITVMVLRTAAEAKTFPMRQSSTDDCAGFPTAYLTLRSRNVVATFADCFNLSPPLHVATKSVLPAVVAAMHSLAHA